jgi:hypothetical protein
MHPKTARSMIAVAGAALLIGFFLPWVDIGFGPTISGYTVARAGHGASTFWLIPIGGLAMLITALMGSRHARLVSCGVGLSLVGYAVVKTVYAFFATTGFGLWVVIAASLGAILLPLLQRRESA